jgi:hypothetical protein
LILELILEARLFKSPFEKGGHGGFAVGYFEKILPLPLKP